jgi:hypothetical protein
MISGTITDAAPGAPCPARPRRPSGIRCAMRSRFSIGFNCALGARTCARTSTCCRKSPTPASAAPSERRPAECLRRLRRNAGRTWPACSASLRVRPAQHRRRLLRHHARAHRARSPKRRGVAPAARRPGAAVHSALSGLEPLITPTGRTFVNVGERTNVTGSAQFRKLIKEDRLRRGARGRAPAGGERRADHRRQHGRGPARFAVAAMRTFLPDRRRAGHRQACR